MTKSNLGSSPNPDLDAKALRAILEAQDLPPGSRGPKLLRRRTSFATPLIFTDTSFRQN